jgi:hypothetical protein
MFAQFSSSRMSSHRMMSKRLLMIAPPAPVEYIVTSLVPWRAESFWIHSTSFHLWVPARLPKISCWYSFASSVKRTARLNALACLAVLLIRPIRTFG